MKLKPFLPSLRDLHLYGGALLVAVGIGFWDWRVALAIAGLYLIYLGEPWK